MGTDLESEFLIRVLKSSRRVFYRNKLKMNAKKLRSTLEQSNTTPQPKHCMSAGERMCEDGSCIARIELCPEEQMMNQNTILIMVVVGLAVVVFLVILYCFQQRQRRYGQDDEGETGLTENDDYDHASLYAPPPNYEDVISTNLYPPTPQQQRLRRISSDVPLTPPPNYDAALIILAQSQESMLTKFQKKTSVFRRSVSLEQINSLRNERSPSLKSNNGSDTPKDKDEKKSHRIFRFSRQFSRHSTQKDYTNVPSQQLSQSPSQTLPCSPMLPPQSPEVQFSLPPSLNEETIS